MEHEEVLDYLLEKVSEFTLLFWATFPNVTAAADRPDSNQLASIIKMQNVYSCAHCLPPSQKLYASRNDDVGGSPSQTTAGLQSETGHQPAG